MVFVAGHRRGVLELLDLADSHAELGIVDQGVEVGHHQQGILRLQLPVGPLPKHVVSTMSVCSLLMDTHNSI